MAQPQLVVFTDLDGTLLDHDTYDWHPAEPAIRRLQAAGIPLVLNSSKTAGEMTRLRRALGNTSPYIVENGAALVIPAGALGDARARIENFGVPREDILEVLAGLRREGYRFRGFADMSVEELMSYTGLDVDSADQARQRYATEPLLWQGDDGELALFRRALSGQGLRLVQGGRFWHVMGNVDKADAVRFLLKAWQRYRPDERWLSIGLGDSPNDIDMLATTDIAVVMPGGASPRIELTDHPRLIHAARPGPRGWNEVMLTLLDEYGY
jgi:mannosyl-3-phosphoglycerate phosphatase